MVSEVDAVVAGHVCLDVIPALEGPTALEPGRLVLVGEAALSAGGSVGNTGVALERLGVSVRLLAKVGDDAFGSTVRDILGARSLDDGIAVAAGEATSYSIVISHPGTDRSFLHCPGVNDVFGADDVAEADLGGARLFHFGYPPMMRRMYADGGVELEQLLADVRARGLVTSLDLCWPDPAAQAARVDWHALLARVLPHVDVFAPSLDEIRFLLGRECDDGDEAVRELAAELLELGATVVALKRGERGLYLRSGAHVGSFCERLRLDVSAWRNCEVQQPCFQPRRVAGTTGAGDATIAGLLAALLRGEGPEEAARAATAVGACSVEAPDATSGIPAWPAIAARIDAGWPQLGEAA